MIAPEFEFVPLRTPEGLILYLKHQPSPWTFRVVPVRDPDQPRLWCLRWEPCAGPSLNAKTARVDPYYTSLAMTREQLAETLGAVRQTTALWLQELSQRELLRWLGSVVRMPIPHDFVPPDPPGRLMKPSVVDQGASVPLPKSKEPAAQ